MHEHATNITTYAASLGAAAVTVLQEVQPEAQQWTVLGLLGVVVVGIGRWLVRAVEKSGDQTTAAIKESTAAQATAATKLELLLVQAESQRRSNHEDHQAILGRLEAMNQRTP